MNTSKMEESVTVSGGYARSEYERRGTGRAGTGGSGYEQSVDMDSRGNSTEAKGNVACRISNQTKRSILIHNNHDELHDQRPQ